MEGYSELQKKMNFSNFAGLRDLAPIYEIFFCWFLKFFCRVLSSPLRVLAILPMTFFDPSKIGGNAGKFWFPYHQCSNFFFFVSRFFLRVLRSPPIVLAILQMTFCDPTRIGGILTGKFWFSERRSMNFF